MADYLEPQAAAKRSADLATKHVAEQRNRIERQRKLILRLEADGHGGRFMSDARQLLQDMIGFLGRMFADQHEAKDRAAQIEPLDEESFDDVMRNCPL